MSSFVNFHLFFNHYKTTSMLTHTRYFFFSILMMALTLTTVTGQTAVTERLQDAVTERGEDEYIRVNLRLAEQYDQQDLYQQSRSIRDRDQRREHVVERLKSFSEVQQADLITYLRDQKAAGLARNIKPLWIANMVNVEIKPALIQELNTRKDLARIDYDKMHNLLLTDDGSSGSSRPGLTDSELAATPVNATDKLDRTNLAWNVTLVNADQVWDMGYTGNDVIVAVMDTGINYNHHDITDNMWQHIDYPGHGYNFIDDTYNTMDYQGHGTHCAGTVAGTGASGTGTGMAPGATIMNLQVLNSSGSGSESAVAAAIQFSVDYGAHVMSLSLGWMHQWNPDRVLLRTAMTSAMNAGLIASVASGNEGGWGGQPPPSEVRTPGDVPPPWTHPDQTEEGGNSAVVSVGATDSNDNMAGFSSKGPVTWQNEAPFNDYNYNPGQGLIRPDIVAPGADVLSLLHSNNTGYTSKSGTSMAAPAVAGIMALILEKNPNLLPEEVNQIIEETAMEMSSSKSNTHGSGRIDALAAILATPYPGIQYVDHELNDSQGNDDGNINPGEFITLDLTLLNPTDGEIEDVEAVFSTESEYITVVDSVANLGDFAAEEEKSFQDIFSFEVADNIPGNYEVVFTIETYANAEPAEIWHTEFQEMAHAPFLEFSDMIIDDSGTGDGDGMLDPGETAEVLVSMTNTGQMTTESIEVLAESDGEWLTVLSYEVQDVESLDPEDSVDLVFEVTAFHDTPLESLATLMFKAHTGAYTFTQQKEIVIGSAPYYSEGDIPSTHSSNPHTGSNALEPGEMTITIPEGATIVGVDVEYDLTSHGGAWMSEQRSFLRCISDGGETEPEVYEGQTNSGGTIEYSRTGLDIANNVEGGGDIDFELHVFRTWGGSGSNTQYVYAPNETWKIIVHYELPRYDVTFRVENQLGDRVENATVEVGNTEKQTDTEGEALFELPEGSLYYSVYAENHRPVILEPFVIEEGTEVIEATILRVFEVAFDIQDVHGNDVPDPVITFDGETLENGDMTVDDLEDGLYLFSIAADGYQTYEGEVEITDSDVLLDIAMNPYYMVHFEVYDRWGTPVEHATITIDGDSHEAGMYDIQDIIPGVHEFTIAAEYFHTYEGEVEVHDQDVQLDITLQEDGTDVTEVTEPTLEIFPNPASESVTIRIDHPGTAASLTVINHTGQMVKSRDLRQMEGEQQIELILNDFSPGVYFITIDDEERTTRKLIVQ